MFKNRTLTVEFKKKAKDTPEESSDEETFEQKAEAIRHIVEGVVVKAFLGVCIYVAVDTVRQVSVAKAIYDHQG